jgi:hypothetical protein
MALRPPLEVNSIAIESLALTSGKGKVTTTILWELYFPTPMLLMGIGI